MASINIAGQGEALSASKCFKGFCIHLTGKTSVDAPRKRPMWSFAIAATDPLFLLTAASTLTLVTPYGGAIHRFIVSDGDIFFFSALV
jgi:hypothetical protein